jgi:hypothetical protein
LRVTCHEVGYELRCDLQNVLFCDFNVLEETLADHYIDITELNIQTCRGTTNVQFTNSPSSGL